MTDIPPIVVNVEDISATKRHMGEHWGAEFKTLTPSMRPRGGNLGINHMRVGPGRTTSPFHSHQREDEAFFVLSGRGVLRYGDRVVELRAGDCVSCPAGTDNAHQIANPYPDEDLVYLAIGAHDPNEVCVYPRQRQGAGAKPREDRTHRGHRLLRRRAQAAAHLQDGARQVERHDHSATISTLGTDAHATKPTRRSSTKPAAASTEGTPPPPASRAPATW